jgi:hypothetical protein
VPAGESGGLRVWHFYLVVGLAGSAAAVTLATDTRVENLVMVSLTIFAAIWAGTTFHRTLMPFSSSEVAEEGLVLSARARAALEREKALALRTIKELEFDRAMGKIADADFNEVVGRLRARAIGIMKQLDVEADGYRGLIERDLKARLAEAGVDRVGGPTPGEGAGAGAAAPTTASVHGVAASAADTGRTAVAEASPTACAACGVANDHDARFCKNCGARMG